MEIPRFYDRRVFGHWSANAVNDFHYFDVLRCFHSRAVVIYSFLLIFFLVIYSFGDLLFSCSRAMFFEVPSLPSGERPTDFTNLSSSDWLYVLLPLLLLLSV